MVDARFELAKAMPLDLQSSPFDRLGNPPAIAALRRPPNFVSLHRPSSFPLKLILSIFPPWRGLEGVPYGHLELSSHQCLHDHLRLWTISSGVSPSSYMLPSTTKTISFLNLKCESRCFQQNYIIPKNASLFKTGNLILANLLHT